MDRTPDGSIWKDLLNRLGCLDNGRFVAPEDVREVFITLRSAGRESVISLGRGRQTSEEWTYTDDFITYNDNNGHITYHAWYNVDTVNTNEA